MNFQTASKLFKTSPELLSILYRNRPLPRLDQRMCTVFCEPLLDLVLVCRLGKIQE